MICLILSCWKLNFPALLCATTTNGEVFERKFHQQKKRRKHKETAFCSHTWIVGVLRAFFTSNKSRRWKNNKENLFQEWKKKLLCFVWFLLKREKKKGAEISEHFPSCYVAVWFRVFHSQLQIHCCLILFRFRRCCKWK